MRSYKVTSALKPTPIRYVALLVGFLPLAVSLKAETTDVERRLRTVAGLDPEVVRQTLTELQAAVRSRDAASFAGHVVFPQVVLLDGQRTIVETAEEFSHNFGEIVNTPLRRVILRQRFADLFVNWRGCMFGSGEIWLGSHAKIIAIHNSPGDVLLGDLPLRFLEPKGREIIPPLDPAGTEEVLDQIRTFAADAHDSTCYYINRYLCRIYKADVNNDGHVELVLTLHGQGSGRYSSVEAVFQPTPDGLVELSFERVVIQSLFPDDDMSKFHLSLAVPFLVRMNNTVYMGFDDNVRPIYYCWDRDDRFTRTPVDGNNSGDER
jgi:hypothetical protein